MARLQNTMDNNTMAQLRDNNTMAQPMDNNTMAQLRDNNTMAQPMDRDTARSVLERLITLHYYTESPNMVADLVDDMIRYEPFASVADDVSARLHVDSVRLHYNWMTTPRSFTDADLPLIYYMLREWSSTDYEDRLYAILDYILGPEGIDLLETMFEGAEDDESANFLREWLYDRLREEPYSEKPSKAFELEDFLRLLVLLVDYDAPPFTLRHVTNWLRHWYWMGNSVVSRTEMDLIFDAVRIDVLDLSSVTRYTPRILLEACRDRWPTGPGEDMDRLCQSISGILISAVPRYLWDVVASHTPLYVAYLASGRQKPAIIHQARRHWRWSRFRVAVRAVAAGAVMWRLYQTWALHPARLAVASSGLAATTARSRAAMDRVNTAPDPALIPATFRLLDMADYVGLGA